MNERLAIEVSDLRYTYPDGTEALKGVSFAVRDRDKVGIIGPNGAGKSTLLTHLNGVKIGNGCVKVCGLEINNRTVHELRSRVGIVFEDPDDQLFCPTVFDDVAFGPLNLRLPADEVRRRVAHALAEVGMSGYDKRSAFHLSLGEKKRISIATVLAMEPDILVLDEPTSDLDLRGRRSLIELIRQVDRTVIVATHDLDLVLDLCSRCLILNGGRIVCDGDTRDLLTNEELLQENGLELPLSLQRRKDGSYNH